MPKTSLLNNIKSYLAIFSALILSVILFIDSLTIIELEFELYLKTALWASLILSLAIASLQSLRSEKITRNYLDQLNVSKERLANEIKHRLWAEKTASENKVKSQFIDENIPIMLAYFTTELRCRYHNRIFRRWFGLTSDQIDGKLINEFSTKEFFSDIQNSVEQILSGKTIHNERIIKSAKGFPYIFTEQYLPHLDSKGKAVGFYTIHTPRAQEKNKSPAKNTSEQPSIQEPGKPEATLASNSPEARKNKQHTTPKTGISAERIAQAITEGEFNLYCQKINPIKSEIPLPSAFEILIRMREEENNLMPPGSFLPLVNQFGMMPKLDRWIIGYIIQWLSTHSRSNTVFYLNIAKDTLRDETISNFVQEQLSKAKIPAASLGFEIELPDAETNESDMVSFVQKIRALGCSVALCSVSEAPESMPLLKAMKVDYIKIDGSLVCNIARDDEDLNTVIEINQSAHRMGIGTIAELVEADDIIAKLQEIGVDYGQGFGIARPHPFKDLEQQ